MSANMRFHRILGILACLAITAAAPAFPAEIAILVSQDIPPYKQAVSSFAAGVGRVTISTHDMNGDVADGRHYLEGAANGGARLIVAVGAKAMAAAADFAERLPVLTLMAPEPAKILGYGSLGFGITLSPNPADQFALLHELLPEAKTIGVIYGSGILSDELTDGLTAARARYRHRYRVVEEKVSSPDGAPGAFRRAVEASDAIWLVFDETVVTEQSIEYLFALALEKRIPVIGFSKKTVQKGALFTAFSDYGDIGAQAAMLAKKALAATAPADIGYLYPETGGYYVNRRIAEHLKIPRIKRFGGVWVEYYE
ncbi:MAG: hypothetical protein HZA03_11275 [Nitrospinae bacterium]|nr:hypothetical protein [Nitrospinota bacterium]